MPNNFSYEEQQKYLQQLQNGQNSSSGINNVEAPQNNKPLTDEEKRKLEQELGLKPGEYDTLEQQQQVAMADLSGNKQHPNPYYNQPYAYYQPYDYYNQQQPISSQYSAMTPQQIAYYQQQQRYAQQQQQQYYAQQRRDSDDGCIIQ